MKRTSLILCLLLVLSGCQLAKELPDDTAQINRRDHLIGIVAYVLSEADSMPNDYIEASCKDDNGDLLCEFDDFSDGYMLIFASPGIDDEHFVNVKQSHTPLMMKDHQIHYNDIEENGVVKHEYSQNVIIDILVNNDYSSSYAVSTYNIYFNKEEMKVYAAAEDPAIWCENMTGTNQSSSFSHSSDYTGYEDGKDVSYHQEFTLNITDTNTIKTNTIKEFDYHDHLIKETVITKTGKTNEYVPSSNCAYLILETIETDRSGNEVFKREIYDKTENYMTAYYNFDNKTIGMFSIDIKWQ